MKRTLQILLTLYVSCTSCTTQTTQTGDNKAVIVDTAKSDIDTVYTVNPLADLYPDSTKLFKKYKNTDFYSTTFVSDNKMGYAAIKYEYIKHADTIIVLDKDLLEDFLIVFANNPNSFGDLFTTLMDRREKTGIDKADFVLGKTQYKTYAVIQQREIIHGIKELIWKLTNHDHILSNNPCYINVIFNYKPNAKSDQPSDLIYLKTIEEYCEI